MGTWTVIVVVIVAAAALGALAWWSSGRSRPGGPRVNQDAASHAQAEGTFQAFQNRVEPPGGGNTF